MRRAEIIGNIILSDLEKINTHSTLANLTILKSLDEISGSSNENTNYVVATTEYAKAIASKKENIYLPYSLLMEKHRNDQVFVYFELEAFPFFHSFSQIIKNEPQPKGVFRFRRTSSKESLQSLMAGELYMFSSLFGELKDIHINKTDSSKVPRHMIIMLHFENGTMAHIEYTVGNQEKIELEWSGIKSIVEFDSDQMKPITPNDKTKSPLTYSVDAILSSARVLDEKVFLQLDDFQKLLDGGAQK
ncbi:hypothetical protein SAMN05518871_10632 [Psychrobacillus sp. OK028]|uniref:hypothetical protein n=1 Tax=Psychrobacillus sp. OK028 TaxID=1884359 RepID=UPI00088FCB33|nr:hypothetical protein [Psychrobacillus sp. OK028]SDN57012.1 hypothetical protein SAMN05518871_10632 [Psychrobacillus sp. OK028]